VRFAEPLAHRKSPACTARKKKALRSS